MAAAVLGVDLRAWRDPWILWGSLAIVVVLLLGAYVIWLVDRWRKQRPIERLNAGDQLTHFRKLYEQGEISAEEFARIRGLLAERLVQELDRQPEPPKPPPPEPPEPPSLEPPKPNGPTV